MAGNESQSAKIQNKHIEWLKLPKHWKFSNFADKHVVQNNENSNIRTEISVHSPKLSFLTVCINIIRGMIRKFAEKCYKIAMLLSITIKIHRYKQPFIANCLKFKLRKCASVVWARGAAVTSFRWNRPYIPLGCFLGLKLVAVFELISILTESNVPSFFEHNVRFFMLFRCTVY